MQDLGPWVWNTSREMRNAMVTSNHLKPYSPSSTQSTVIRTHDWCKIMSWRIAGGSCTYAAKSWFWRCSSFNRTFGNFCVTQTGKAEERLQQHLIVLARTTPLSGLLHVACSRPPLCCQAIRFGSRISSVFTQTKTTFTNKPQGSPTNRLSRNLKTMISKESPFPEMLVWLDHPTVLQLDFESHWIIDELEFESRICLLNRPS